MGEKARAEREAVRGTFEGAVSEAFESALHLYVGEEAKELSTYLEVRQKQGVCTRETTGHIGRYEGRWQLCRHLT